jgi:pseudaminic acid biosynthesis-associated methylase
MQETKRTPQEEFWAGEFGNHYIDRNKNTDLQSSKVAMFSRIVEHAPGVSSVLELGANIGLNIVALKCLLPSAQFHAVEINEVAFSQLSVIPDIRAELGSLLDKHTGHKVDLSFTCGVLIHINPDRLVEAYARLYESSRRYVLVAEYYNQNPVELLYRGHTGKLFKRDFAGDLMQKYPDLKLIDYGFVYRNDPMFPLDDVTWFLMEKR